MDIGTTLAAAEQLGRRGIGADLNAQYLDDAADRLARLVVQLQMETA